VLPDTSDLPQDFGPYRLLSVLGEGGMARVYRAEKQGRRGFSTESALKIMKRKAGKRSEFVQLLTREAIIGGFLRHPNIVATIDFNDVDGHYYIAMQLVEGETLEALMSAAKDSGDGTFPPLLGLDLVQQLCRGLSYAHALSDRDGKPLEIIHRDIKPGNIMVSQHGVAKLTDFGIAKAAVETGVVTATNVVRGTPLYMSPEQATGRPLDHRSDLFSVGLILYETLTGKRLFEMRDIVSTMENIARAEVGNAPTELEDVVPGLGAVFRKLMQLNPRARHANAQELEGELAELAAELAVSRTDRGDTESVRESLKSLEDSAAKRARDSGPRRTPDPTLPSTSNRIPIDRKSLDDDSSIYFEDIHDVDTGVLVSISDPEAAPVESDPVIRRTHSGLRALFSRKRN
jgi:serine/threonine protein kinase